MMKNLRKAIGMLLILALIISCIPISSYAVSGTINFSGIDSSETGDTVTDGQTGAVAASDVAGVDIDIFGSNDKTTKVGKFIYLSFQNVITPSDVPTYTYNYIVIQSRDGTNFNLQSININNCNMTEDAVYVEGIRDGSTQGTVNLTLDAGGMPSQFNSTNGLTASIFQNVDKIVISSNTVSATDVTAGIGAIQIGEAVSTDPAITSATYNSSTGELVVTATNLVSTAGVTNDIDASMLTLTGEGGATYILTDTADVEITSGTSFTIVLSAADKTAVNLILNKNGTSSTSGTTYNLAAAEDWATGADPAVVVADTAGNGITVSNVAIPTITSATYDATTGALIVTGTGLLKLNGATNDIDVSKLTLTGEGGGTHTLTTSDVEISSGTEFTVSLNVTDKVALNQIFNKNGTSSTGGTTYNLAAAEDWAAGADSAVAVADTVGNAITVSNVSVPTITSAAYDATTGTLVVTGTGLLKLNGADIVANKFTLTGEGGATYTLTNTPNVEITSGTSFEIYLSGTDKASVNLILNKIGTSSTSGTTYNLAAAEDWAAGADPDVAVADTTGNGIAVSNVAVPTITSAAYDASTGALVVTGTRFLKLSGDSNDIVANKFTFTGDGGATYALTNTSNVEISSETSFTIILSENDKADVNLILNKNGTSSMGGTTFNLAAAEDWAAGADPDVAVADATGNGITVSKVSPKVTITSTEPNLTNSSPFSVTITFTEGVSDFDLGDIMVTNGAASNISGSGTTYTADITPADQGVVKVNIAAGVAHDSAGIGNTAATELSRTYDSIVPNAPTITTLPQTINADSITISGTAEAGATITITGGAATATGVADGGGNYSISVNLTQNTVNTLAVKATDATGNNSGAASLAITEDSSAAIVSSLNRQTPSDASTNATSVTFRVTFSESVSGVDTSDFTLTKTDSADGIIASVLTVSALIYDVTVNSITGTGTLRLDLNSSGTGIIDIAGNTIATGYTSGQTYTVDTTAPSVTITPTAPSDTNTSPITVTITFSESVTGFAAEDITVGNGTVGNFTAVNAATYTADITPSGQGAVTVNVAENVGQDTAGNNNTAATQLIKNYDSIAPTVTITSAAPTNTNTSPIPVTITFSESVTGFAVGDITVGNGTAGNFVAVSGTTYTADITPSIQGAVTVDVVANIAQDVAGNNNTAGTQLSRTYDTTAPTVGGGGTIGVSQLTNNSAKLTWPVATDSITLEADLQYKVVYSTSDITTVAAADALTGTWTPNITTITVTGLTAGTDYYFNVLVKDQAGNMALYSSETGKTTAAPTGGDTTSGNTAVEVNGQKQDAGTIETTTTGGQTTTTIKVDDTKLNTILENSGEKPTVTLPTNTNSDVVVGELNGQTVKNMETKEAVLEIKTETVTYTLPASQINIDSVSSQIGSQVELKDIKVSVKIAEPSADTVKIVENTANKGNYQIVVKPVEFEITCTSGGKTVEVSKFNGYVERTVAIPDGVDPSKITTGIVLNADGSFSHVPTTIAVINGKYYAKINSLTNSVYSVIYNPVTFTDVFSHWAKDAVNNMGSRMVVTGMGNGTYEPDRSITRAEFAAIVVRAMGLQKGTTESAFGDVSASDWFNGYVDTATSYALITGYDSGSYGPTDTITREQAMAILARAMKLTGLSVSLTDTETSALLAKFTDGSKVSEYAKTSAAMCLKTGVVTGSSATTISPKDYVTRAEVAVMVQRLLQKSGLI